MRYWLLILALFCAQAQAGEWFRYTTIAVGAGTEYEAEYKTTGRTIGSAPLMKVEVSQSIYSDESLTLSVEYQHLSSGVEHYPDDRPLDYFGIEAEYRHDWY